MRELHLNTNSNIPHHICPNPNYAVHIIFILFCCHFLQSKREILTENQKEKPLSINMFLPLFKNIWQTFIYVPGIEGSDVVWCFNVSFTRSHDELSYPTRSCLFCSTLDLMEVLDHVFMYEDHTETRNLHSLKPLLLTTQDKYFLWSV